MNLLPKSKLGATAALVPKPTSTIGSGGIFGGDFLTKAVTPAKTTAGRDIFAQPFEGFVTTPQGEKQFVKQVEMWPFSALLWENVTKALTKAKERVDSSWNLARLNQCLAEEGIGLPMGKDQVERDGKTFCLLLAIRKLKEARGIAEEETGRPPPATTTSEKEADISTNNPEPRKVEITVKQIAAKKDAKMVLAADAPMAELQKRLQVEIGIEPSLQRLVFAGKELKGDATIKEQGLKDQSVIHLVIKRVKPTPKGVPAPSSSVGSALSHTGTPKEKMKPKATPKEPPKPATTVVKTEPGTTMETTDAINSRVPVLTAQNSHVKQNCAPAMAPPPLKKATAESEKHSSSTDSEEDDDEETMASMLSKKRCQEVAKTSPASNSKSVATPKSSASKAPTTKHNKAKPRPVITPAAELVKKSAPKAPTSKPAAKAAAKASPKVAKAAQKRQPIRQTPPDSAGPSQQPPLPHPSPQEWVPVIGRLASLDGERQVLLRAGASGEDGLVRYSVQDVMTLEEESSVVIKRLSAPRQLNTVASVYNAPAVTAKPAAPPVKKKRKQAPSTSSPEPAMAVDRERAGKRRSTSKKDDTFEEYDERNVEYECELGCGFESTSQAEVEEHELTCKGNAMDEESDEGDKDRDEDGPQVNETVSVQWPRHQHQYQAVVLEDTKKGKVRVQFDGTWETSLIAIKQVKILPKVALDCIPPGLRPGQHAEALDPFAAGKAKWHAAKVVDVRQGSVVKNGQQTIVDEESAGEPGWRFWVKFVASGGGQWVGRHQIKAKGGASVGASAAPKKRKAPVKKVTQSQQQVAKQTEPEEEEDDDDVDDDDHVVPPAPGLIPDQPGSLIYKCLREGCRFEFDSEDALKKHQVRCMLYKCERRGCKFQSTDPDECEIHEKECSSKRKRHKKMPKTAEAEADEDDAKEEKKRPKPTVRPLKPKATSQTDIPLNLNETVAVQWPKTGSKHRFQAVVIEAPAKGKVKIQFDGTWQVARVKTTQVNVLHKVKIDDLPAALRPGQGVQALDPYGDQNQWHAATIEEVIHGAVVEAGKPAIMPNIRGGEDGWRFWVKYEKSEMRQWVGREQIKGEDVDSGKGIVQLVHS